MKSRFLRSCGIVFLSLVLLYSGVAWALENCLRSGDDVSHPQGGLTIPYLVDPVFAFTSRPPHPRETKLHCLESLHQIGPMMQSSTSPRLAPLTEGVPLKSFPSRASAASCDLKDFWLRASFGKFSSFSFLSGLSPYLFLSVLRI